MHNTAATRKKINSTQPKPGQLSKKHVEWLSLGLVIVVSVYTVFEAVAKQGIINLNSDIINR